MLSLSDLAQLAAVTKQLAKRELLSRFKQISHDTKLDGSLITQADLVMQQSMQSALASAWPHINFLGEEMSPDSQLGLLNDTKQGLWVLDPLDGTMNFSMGIPFFSVSLALLWDKKIQAGVVYDPIRDECFTALQGQGAYLNGQRFDLSALAQVEQLRVGTVDYKRLPTKLATQLINNPPYQSQRSFGSVALDWCWLAAGRGQVYVHGKQNLWDYAAGALILSEAGGYACTLEGEPVFNASLQPRSAVLAINQHLFTIWCQYLRRAMN